jgi:malate synthase
MAVSAGGLSIDEGIHGQIVGAAAAVNINADELIKAFGEIVRDLAPVNDRLLADRDRLQGRIDEYFTGRKGQAFDPKDYERFLRDIGYVVPEGGKATVATQNVDPEFTTAAPQLVCPVFIGEGPATNARYPLNAVNARWGSLYDAVYGKPGDKNVIDENEGKGFPDGYNPRRGEAVIAYVNRELLDQAAPLEGARHEDVLAYEVRGGQLLAKLVGGREAGLAQPEKFAGYNTKGGALSSLLLKNNGLHIELAIDRNHPIGSRNQSGVRDVIVESALTSIVDLEDAASAVDARDKGLAYRNVIGLMKGNLTADVVKGKSTVKRGLDQDRTYTKPGGGTLTLPGRSVMLFRRVGLHMYTDAVKYDDKGALKAIPEGFLDTLMIALASLSDLRKAPGELRNSKTGSVYIVMPKQHGPEEVKLTVDLFSRIEKALNLKPNALKIGIMDEEQRTSVNLRECIRAANDRVVFINTGFLDRTGDLIHTAMAAGPMDTKAGMKAAPWLDAYERGNMQVGLDTELNTHGQIGKGMWTQNRNPAGLVATKAEHPRAGATTAWVPDPKGAALHALHYHQVDVSRMQQQLLEGGNPPVDKGEMLNVPLLPGPLTPEARKELAYGYSQSILGYVVRWVDQGIGCSSVPDHTGVYLMEDRATLRIGSQELANWLKHGVISEDELNSAMVRAARTVDEQNKGDPAYTPLVGNYDGPAFQAAMRLIHEGASLPNGYVEPVLHAARREVKATGAWRGGNEVRYIPTVPGTSPMEAGGERVG